ncbi:MAG TPA: hypothetical protein PKD41_15005, partial [Solidesulfovibrio sp.]|nr:hypothetical protein [Desulfovibrio sp.]HML62203.1 hypothetical protein [Solidesulfovibrio sp.]
MHTARTLLPCVLAACIAAASLVETRDTAEAGMPAPLPTQIPIRDITAPPTPNTPTTPFTPAPAPAKRRRVKKPRKRQPRPAPQQSAPKAQAPAGPKLEQRYEPPTESIIPLDPVP